MDNDAKYLARKLIIDILLLLCVGIPILLLFLMGEPYQRGFFCNDESLMHPYHDSTVPSYYLYILGLGMPVIVMLGTEWMLARDEVDRPLVIGRHKLPAWAWHAYCAIIVFGFGATCSQFTTDVIKYTVGRLRPHFFNVCKPNVNCTDPANLHRYIQYFTCENDSDGRLLKEVRLSFPSGHSSFSMYTMFYLAIYMQARWKWSGSKLLRHFCQYVCIMLSVYTAMTRVSDYKHHWSDVLGGLLLGVFVAVLVALSISDLFTRKRHFLPATDVDGSESEMSSRNRNGFVIFENSDDDSSNGNSSSGLTCEENAANEITSELTTAGPTGVGSSRNFYSFKTNPAARKRHRNRLIRKLQRTIDEFSKLFGQQAVVIISAPDPPKYKVFGTKPLKNVMNDLRRIVMEELECALAQQPPSPVQNDQMLFELPPLTMDGIVTPVEKMTQGQLRAFIPLILKYSTGREKPGWNTKSNQPPWWPDDVPWANVRTDVRSDTAKQKVTWTHALRQIVINCYKYHGLEDLLPVLTEEQEMTTRTMQGNPDGTMNQNNPIITLPDGTTIQVPCLATIQTNENDLEQTDRQGEVIDVDTATLSSNGQIIFMTEDGQPVSVSGVITVPANFQHIETISDETNEVQGLATLQTTEKDLEQTDRQGEVIDVDTATLNSNGQIIFMAEDGQPVSASGVITVPANFQHIETSSDETN